MDLGTRPSWKLHVRCISMVDDELSMLTTKGSAPNIPYLEKVLNWKGSLHLWRCRSSRDAAIDTSTFDNNFEVIWRQVEEKGPMATELGLKREGSLRLAWLGCGVKSGTLIIFG